MGTNRYAYSANDPVNKLDPGGNCYSGSYGLAGCFPYDTSTENRFLRALNNTATYIANTPASMLNLAAEPVLQSAEALAPYADSIDGVAMSMPQTRALGLPAKGVGALGAVATEARVAQTVITVQRNSGALRSSLGLAKGDPRIAHHTIPVTEAGHPVVQAAMRGGFDFNGAENGTIVLRQAGNHQTYTASVRRRLNRLAEVRNMTDTQAANALRGLSAQLSDGITTRWGGIVRNDPVDDFFD